MPTETKYVVQVIEYKTKGVIHTTLPMPERQANKVDAGMNRNLNHDKYYTLVEPVAVSQ